MTMEDFKNQDWAYSALYSFIFRMLNTDEYLHQHIEYIFLFFSDCHSVYGSYLHLTLYRSLAITSKTLLDLVPYITRQPRALHIRYICSDS